MSELCVAAAQAVSIRGAVEANLERHCRLAERAGAEGVEVLVFPELSVTGYELDLASKLAFAAGDDRLEPVLEVAAARRVVLIVGAPIRCADTSHPEHAAAAAERGASLYLAGVFFDPESYPTSAARLSGHALRHAMTVVMANAGGPATGFESAGGSAVWSDSGALVSRLAGRGAGLVVARRSQSGWSGEALAL